MQTATNSYGVALTEQDIDVVSGALPIIWRGLGHVGTAIMIYEGAVWYFEQLEARPVENVYVG